jgi:hypothetical protein
LREEQTSISDDWTSESSQERTLWNAQASAEKLAHLVWKFPWKGRIEAENFSNQLWGCKSAISAQYFPIGLLRRL